MKEASMTDSEQNIPARVCLALSWLNGILSLFRHLGIYSIRKKIPHIIKKKKKSYSP